MGLVPTSVGGCSKISFYSLLITTFSFPGSSLSMLGHFCITVAAAAAVVVVLHTFCCSTYSSAYVYT